MPPPDSGAIDEALVDLLQADAALAAVMPDGVYWDVAPAGSTRVVLVSLASHVDTREFNQRSFEEAVYLVRAVALSTLPNANTETRSAAARIDAVLEQATLTAPGFEPMALFRLGRRHETERDDLDPSMLWFTRGGQYQVLMSYEPTGV